MRSRSLLLALFALLASACHQGPLHAEYPQGPRAVRRAVREVMGRCRPVGPRILQRGPQLYEVRGCGAPISVACSGSEDDCQVVADPTTTLAAAPAVDAETVARAAEIERLAREQEADDADVHAAVLTSGAVLIGVSAIGFMVGVLGYTFATCGLSTCPPDHAGTIALMGGIAIAGAAIGLTMLVAGGISWRLALDRRHERGQRLAEPCGGIAFTATPWLASVVTEICFP